MEVQRDRFNHASNLHLVDRDAQETRLTWNSPAISARSSSGSFRASWIVLRRAPLRSLYGAGEAATRTRARPTYRCSTLFERKYSELLAFRLSRE
jgi:hypothetical protein